MVLTCVGTSYFCLPIWRPGILSSFDSPKFGHDWGPRGPVAGSNHQEAEPVRWNRIDTWIDTFVCVWLMRLQLWPQVGRKWIYPMTWDYKRSVIWDHASWNTSMISFMLTLPLLILISIEFGDVVLSLIISALTINAVIPVVNKNQYGWPIKHNPLSPWH